MRRLLLAEDGKCANCGHVGSADNGLELDHITPRKYGGITTRENLQILCRRCNLAKADRVPGYLPKQAG